MKFAGLLSKLLLIIVANLLLVATNNAFAQKLLGADTTVRRDSLSKVNSSTGKNKQTPAKAITVSVKDTSKTTGGMNSVGKAVAEDSSYIDNERKITYLYGKARVTYEDYEIDADYIRLDEKNHMVFASGRKDPKTGQYIGRPIIKQKSDKPTFADSLYFNYESKKAKVYNPAVEQEGNFLSGGVAKRLNETEVAYHNVLYSTCDLPYPDTHFGIVITRGIAEKKQIISGPAYLEIANVPLPIGLPFAFFPKPDSRASGIMLPTFGEDAKLGFFLRDFGYYRAINDNVDLTTTGTLYSKGSFELGTVARYLKRYNYTGTMAFRFSSLNYGNPGDPHSKNFNIQWSHSQDPNAHPGSVFSASVNAGTSSYYSSAPGQNNYSLSQLTQNNLSSSIAYQRTWPNSPFNLTVNLSHSQDLTKKTINLDLPSFNFNMASLSPFDSKERLGEQKWYQRISMSYSASGTNRVSNIPESELFQGDLVKRLQSGIKQTIPVSLNLPILKYIQFATNATYNEYWNFQTIRKNYDRNTIYDPSVPIIDTVPGFRRAGDYSFSASLSTKLYGTMNFKGRIRAIRHVMTPNIGFSYSPNFVSLDRNYIRTSVTQSTIPYPYHATVYSIFEGTAVGGPSGSRSGSINFSLDNSIEAKVRAKSTDTSQTDKKISILQSLTFNTSYNLAADSFRLSNLTFSGHTAIFNQKVNINFGGFLNPYAVHFRDSISNSQLQRYSRVVNKFTWQEGKLPRLESFTISADMSLNSSAGKRNTPYNPYSNAQVNQASGLTPEQAERLAMVNQDQAAFVDFNIPWNVNLSYSFNYSLVNSGLGTTVTNTVQARGDVSITPKWKVTYYSDMDIRKQKVTTMQLGIYRDLHCWDLSVQWIPFGYYKMYSVMLRVKASILQDLKMSKRSDFTNNSTYNPYY